jgi:4-amino-4-deoxy-L-arabinose transferase-like glycosyltransferase
VIDTENILKKLLAAAAIFFIMLFAYVSLSRIGYPFELEWMEGGSVEHLERIMDGESIYTPPSLEFIPYIYTPLYYYAAVPLVGITGVGLLSLRIVSLVSTLALFFVIFLFVKKETGSKYYGLLASGLFAASFRIGGAWFDLARVDMLYILLLMIAVYIIRFHKSPGYYFLAALIAGLSFFTKQTAAVLFAPVGIYLLVRERRASWWFNITFALIVILTTVYYTVTTDGWYYFWNFTLPTAHRWNNKYLILYWTYDLIKPYAVSILFGIVFLVATRNNNKNTFYFYISLIAGVVISTWLSRLHYGGYSNVLIPAYLLVTVIGIIGYKLIPDVFGDRSDKKLLLTIFSLALLFQYTTLLYSPRDQIPTKEDEKAGWALVEKIKSYEGDVFIYSNPYLARLAGKKVYAHSLLIRDLIESNTNYSEPMRNEFFTALKRHKFAIVIDYPQLDFSPLNKYYTLKEDAFREPKVFRMRTGYTTRPEHIFIPKK